MTKAQGRSLRERAICPARQAHFDGAESEGHTRICQRNLALGTQSIAEPTVIVVEDDTSIRVALRRLFGSVGLRVVDYGSAADLLQNDFPDAPSCLVLDIRLPGRSGLDLQEDLAATGVQLPIIFMTGHGDIPMTVRAMKAGAVDFLSKPFRDQDMLDAVAAAIERDRVRRAEDKGKEELRARFESLTGREREIMALATSGLMNKQIAAKLGLSEITVKIHRGHVTKKMKARNFADLVRMGEALGIGHGTKTSDPGSGGV